MGDVKKGIIPLFEGTLVPLVTERREEAVGTS